MATDTDQEQKDATKRASSKPPPASGAKKGKKKTAAEVQKELRELTKTEDRPPLDLKKTYSRIAILAVVVWIIAIIIPGWIPKAVAGGLTVVAAGIAVWMHRFVTKSQALTSLLKDADTEEGRKRALEELDTKFKKSDTQAVIAKAQLLMQEDPRKALEVLEGINLDKELAPVAGQVRALRAMIHLSLGEPKEALALADKLELGKQQEPKTRAMFAAVASEAWARTGQGKKAVETLDLFNPEAPDMAEMRAQIWRARAFAYAAVNDTKGIGRALKKLSEMNPHLLSMFIGQKKIHPLLEREAKQMVMRLGIVPKKMVRQKM